MADCDRYSWCYSDRHLTDCLSAEQIFHQKIYIVSSKDRYIFFMNKKLINNAMISDKKIEILFLIPVLLKNCDRKIKCETN